MLEDLKPHKPWMRNTMSLAIRPSHEGDLPALTRIYAHAVETGTASFELEPPIEAEMARRRDAVLAGGYPHLVAELEGLAVGYAYASAFRPRPAYRFTVEDSIYVSADRQGNGIGRALLSALIAECEKRGFRQMIAVIGDRASRGSIRLHEQAGFAHAGVLPSVGFKHDGWRDIILMQRALGDSDTRPPN
jgi:L-amino acid N-acyltransferase YncA